MDIKRLFSKIFNKSKSTNPSASELVPSQLLVDIPKRRKFKNNAALIAKIDEYKHKYRELLSNPQTITSKELSFGDYYDQLRLNIFLLLNIFYSDENSQSLLSENEDEISKQLKREINDLKLNLYNDEIASMENESIARCIALNEVYHEKRFFLRSDKANAANEELNNLRIQLNLFFQQKIAVEREKTNYQIKIAAKNLSTDIDPELLEQKAKEKLEKLYEMAEPIIPDVTSEIKSRNESAKPKLAALEKAIETSIFAKRDYIDNIIKSIDTYLSKEELKEDNLMSKISFYEKVFYLFDTYGRNLVTKEQLLKLYELKFRLLTDDIYQKRKSPFENIDERESKLYQEIIMKKINELLKINNPIIQNTFGSNGGNALSILVNLLKGNSQTYQPEEILLDYKRLSLLLAFDEHRNIQSFFDNMYFKTDNSELKPLGIFIYPNITWEEEIPLETIFRMKLSDPDKKSCPNLYPYFKLYLYMTHHLRNNPNIYHIPEGIVTLNMEYSVCPISPLYVPDNHNISYIVCPKSLKKWEGSILPNPNNKSRIQKILLNEGLTTFDVSGDDKNISISSVTIPSTLEFFRLSAYAKGEWGFNLSNIIFNNPGANYILHNKHCFQELIKLLFAYLSRFKHSRMLNQYDTSLETLSFEQTNNQSPIELKIRDIEGNVEYDEELFQKYHRPLVYDDIRYLSKEELTSLETFLKDKIRIKSETPFDYKRLYTVCDKLTNEQADEILSHLVPSIEKKLDIKLFQEETKAKGISNQGPKTA